jgi:hypothetical protein
MSLVSERKAVVRQIKNQLDLDRSISILDRSLELSAIKDRKAKNRVANNSKKLNRTFDLTTSLSKSQQCLKTKLDFNQSQISEKLKRL